MVTKKELEHLAELGRIELESRSEKKLLHDLEEILAYFDELKRVDTEKAGSLAGGSSNKNIWREDGGERVPNEKALADFPEKEKGFLKVPPVFGE